ncbi:hypothetical protein NYE70_11460 [Paenibacillus sp. FSL R5-0407]|uniref:hypothetical protein n=1 Tax=Paenibacillus sp. FSL R5-0407 TaxID=2975320 RepID=UPI0030FD06BC
MDEQTLKYMGERVDKARKIQRKIKDLEHVIEYSAGKFNIKILDQSSNGPYIEYREFGALATRAKDAILDQVREEIKLLKQELAEL